METGFPHKAWMCNTPALGLDGFGNWQRAGPGNATCMAGSAFRFGHLFLNPAFYAYLNRRCLPGGANSSASCPPALRCGTEPACPAGRTCVDLGADPAQGPGQGQAPQCRLACGSVPYGVSYCPPELPTCTAAGACSLPLPALRLALRAVEPLAGGAKGEGNRAGLGGGVEPMGPSLAGAWLEANCCARHNATPAGNGLITLAAVQGNVPSLCTLRVPVAWHNNLPAGAFHAHVTCIRPSIPTDHVVSPPLPAPIPSALPPAPQAT